MNILRLLVWSVAARVGVQMQSLYLITFEATMFGVICRPNIIENRTIGFLLQSILAKKSKVKRPCNLFIFGNIKHCNLNIEETRRNMFFPYEK